MFKAQMKEKEEDFVCQNNHDQPIHLVVLDPKLDKKQRFLCTQCLDNFESDLKTIGFQKIIKIIQDKQESRMNNLDILTQETIQKLQKCITITQQLKSQYIKLFDSLIAISQDWTQNLIEQRRQPYEYSFYYELDNYIQNLNLGDLADTKLIHNINQSWMTKLYNNLNQYNQDKNKLNINQLKQQFMNIINEKKSLEHLIKFNLIDQSVKQDQQCNAIVFDSSDKIMVSAEYNKIKVWSFINGTIQQINTLQGHTNWILCLIYSKKQNSFISGDKTLRCWKQINQIEWKSSQAYQQHNDYIRCIIMNSYEHLLFSGSQDKSINVWKIDFNQNELTYLYSLKGHNNYVMSLSLNSSENQLVSCASNNDQIIIWERQQLNNFKFKCYIKQSIQNFGFKVKFINDNQFIWVSGQDEIDKLYVFELKEGIFQENQEKTVQLVKNNRIFDESRFPIVYNKEKNLIVVRHKTHIYLIRIINNGNFKLDHQLNCETNLIYGTVTNNWKYLVYWDFNNKGYSIYEL